MTTVNAAAYDAATQALDPPLAVVDLDAFDANARDLVRRARGLPIRIASKSVRCRELLERALAMPGFGGLLCYSLPEALWLHHCGVSDDLVVAYPTVDHAALRTLATDDAARAAVTIMVDSTEHLDAIDAAIGPAHPEIRVALELDVSWRPAPGLHIGTRRSPVFRPRAAQALASRVAERRGFRLVGMMAYEGQIAGVPDGGRGLEARMVRWIQRRSAAELARRRGAAVAAVRRVADLEFVNGGGTGSIESTGDDPSVTEIAAGSGLLGPGLFDSYTRFTPQPAALFALPVVRRPTRDIATVFAGGYVASGPPKPSRLPAPVAPAGLALLGVEGAGEVQTPVTGAAARDLALGDRVWFRHAKAGELAEHFPEYQLVRGSRIDHPAPTYRGEAKSFG
ncbi:D-serine deaminase-like pyridoxal phosphate-dependent protein [Prauserella isguenensis]|uniref:D-serine deaminase-like pyridoxal phosphate-dependent protein n=1 Tax=Prauserella isguenensis TaxID=1470180 RepID=A0A839RY92_9PSEU|nr:D-serine deaminase-like pyridoxal phosphate-dependent protein [Prauserella isguenensis]